MTPRIYTLAGGLLLLGLALSGCRGGSGKKTPTSAPATVAPTAAATGTTAAATPVASATVPGGSAPTPAPSTAGTVACVSADLQARANEQGVPGSIGGSLTLQNVSSRACSIGQAGASGTPEVSLVDASGASLKLQLSALPGLSLPNVVLGANQSTSITFVWSNWCSPPPAAPIAVAVTLARGAKATAPISGSDAAAGATPRCDDASQPSVLQVSGFAAPR
ncbi:MAG: DUF4232 domain-containing protein [Dehalococcoidia bacterium]|nr:DUF4232 domain-containing protein [Dehalococcoidia bacterium]